MFDNDRSDGVVIFGSVDLSLYNRSDETNSPDFAERWKSKVLKFSLSLKQTIYFNHNLFNAEEISHLKIFEF